MTSVSGTGTFDGNQPITITGTEFHQRHDGELHRHQPARTGDQHIDPADRSATNVSVNVQNQTITAFVTGVTTLANYYITVTTPGGQTSAVMPNASCTPPLVDCFVYTSVAPQVSSVTPTNGYTTHSTAITIKGSGSINGATVTMVPDGNGSPAEQATAVQVLSNTEITRPSPTHLRLSVRRST